MKSLTRTMAVAILTALPASVAPAAGPTTNPAPPKVEQDRRAILSMAGAYAVRFHFEETVPLRPGYVPHEADDTGARELVVVVTDEPRHVELQHLLVAGETVVKHWRQEWLYENRELLEFKGNDTWKRRDLTASEAAGTWTQRVSNVDDSPRYEGFGTWEHGGNWTAWESNETWRPLPRREYTTRNDYQVIVGRNRHLLTPAGWAHEQDNAKVVLTDGPPATLVLERGLNTYTRCDPAELNLAAEEWQRSAPFWAQVRSGWGEIRAVRSELVLKELVDGRRLFETLDVLRQRALTGEVTPTEIAGAIARHIARVRAVPPSTEPVGR